MRTALLRSPLPGQLLRFAGTSGLSALVTLGLPVLLHEGGGVGDDKAVAIALTAAFFLNFFTTRSFVFRANGDPRHELMRFALASLVFRGLEYLVFLFVNNVIGLTYIYALLIVLLVSIPLKFFCYRLIVFPDRRESGTRGEVMSLQD